MGVEYEITRFLILPGRKVYGLIVERDVGAEALKEVAEILAKHGILVASQQCTFLPERKSVRTLIFMDMTEADVSIKELIRELRGTIGVRSVEAIYPTVEGFVADTGSRQLFVGGERALIFRKPVYKGLLANIRRQFGGAGEAFLYYQGYDSGIELGKIHQRIAESLGLKDPIEILRKISAQIYVSMGLGGLEIVEATLKPPQVIMRLYDNPECELGIGAGKPYSHWIRGIMAGFLTQLFKVEMKAEEILCIAKKDPYCELKIIRRE